MEFFKNYEISNSLWDMIIENVSPNEIFEVKSFLGDDLVDQSIELKNEIMTLIEIYKLHYEEHAAGDCSRNILPEPPEVRERLIKEIQFFVSQIREQALLQGRNPERVLESRSSDIIDYAYESSSSRPTTANDLGSLSSYRATPISDRVNVNLFKEKLNYIEFEEVQSYLKQILQDEVDRLNEDMKQIHNVLYEDDTDRCQPSMKNKHSISELKRERHELEQILLQTSRSSSSDINMKIGNSTNHYPSKAGNKKKPIFKLVPDGEKASALSIKSPPKLKPIEYKDSNKSSSYCESPLDLGLPEILTLSNQLDQNNSSVSCSDKEDSLKLISPDSLISERSSKFNAALKFRQMIFQNRKETLYN